ncbi:hypothetical protein ACFQX6_02315 [Streptosporangium lutulentum]
MTGVLPVLFRLLGSSARSVLPVLGGRLAPPVRGRCPSGTASA